MSDNWGLVLTGGGARAAFQAGVLRGLSEVLGEGTGDSMPFKTITGLSAGAINGAFLATQTQDFRDTTQKLWQIWCELEVDQVVKTNLGALAQGGFRWLRDLTLGGVIGVGESNYLLDTHPLREFLSTRIDFSKIEENIRTERLSGVAVSATNYKTGTAITFYDGNPKIKPWFRTSRMGQRTTLSLDHVLASASIPILFSPVRLQNSFFGDGGIRLPTPLSPAIHLGADRIFAIGIRYFRSATYTQEINQASEMKQISLADIAGVMLNAAFLDALESDLERMERINQTLSLMSAEVRAQHPQKLRRIPIFTLRPSRDLGSMASEQFHRLPRMLRYLMKGVGASDLKGWDFLSYLAFDRAYTERLLDLGYHDALAQKDEILKFFHE